MSNTSSLTYRAIRSDTALSTFPHFSGDTKQYHSKPPKAKTAIVISSESFSILVIPRQY